MHARLPSTSSIADSCICNDISINAHAQELRSYFVAHEGKKRLVVKTVGDRHIVDYGSLAPTFTKKIHENVRAI